MTATDTGTIVRPGRQAKRIHRTRTIVIVEQDALMRAAVKRLEDHHTANKWSWSWLSNKSGVSLTTFNNWRKKKTRSGLTRTMNAALKPLGLALVIGKLK